MSKAASNRGVMIVLSYLWFLAIVPFLIEKNDLEVRWHARHGLLLMGAELVAFGALSVLIGLVTLVAFSVGMVLSVCFVLAWIGLLVLHMAAIVRGLNGRRLEVPGVSGFADRW